MYKLFTRLQKCVNVQTLLLILKQLIRAVKPKSAAKPQKEAFKRFRTENNDRDEVCRHLYLSFLVWHILKYSNREVGRDTTSWIQMGNALNANGFSLSCCYQFIFSIWVLKRQIEVSPCPSTPSLPPPWGQRRSEVKEISDSSTQHTKGT